MSPFRLIELAAVRGKWIDQSQSYNVFYAGNSGKEISDIYMACWVKGLKTTYYLRTLGASGVDKTTLDSTNVKFKRAAPKVCSIDNPDCEACQ